MDTGNYDNKTGERGREHSLSPKSARESTLTKWHEAGWDEEGGLDQWYKQEEEECQDYSCYIKSQSDGGTINSCPPATLKSVNFSKSAEFVEIWDDEFDFCVKEEAPQGVVSDNDVNSSPSKKKRQTKNKAIEVLNKSKDYIKSKVANCRKKLNNSSLNFFSPVHRGRHSKFLNNCCEANVSHSEVKQILEPVNHDRVQVLTNSSPPECDRLLYPCASSKPSDKHSITGDLTQDVDKNDTSSSRSPLVQSCTNTTVYVTIETEKKSVPSSTIEELQPSDTMPGLFRSQTDTGVHYRGVPGIEINQDDADLMEENNIASMTKSVEEAAEQCQEEDIPLGTEANSFDQTDGKRPTFVTVLPPVMDKRLQWLLDTPHHHSFGSDFSQNTNTSNSSDISLDMLLNERFEDPEDILIGLGFGDSEEVEDTIQRIPERFLSKPSELDGIDISSLIEENPELSSLFQCYIDSQNNSADLSGQGQCSTGALDSKFEDSYLVSAIHNLLHRCVPKHFIDPNRISEFLVQCFKQPENESSFYKDFRMTDLDIEESYDLEVMQSHHSKAKLPRPESLEIQVTTELDYLPDSRRSSSSISTPSPSAFYKNVRLSPDETIV